MLVDGLLFWAIISIPMLVGVAASAIYEHVKGIK
jgi:hypothetical protein